MGRYVRLTVQLPEAVHRALDAMSKKTGRSRSALMAEIASYAFDVVVEDPPETRARMSRKKETTP